MSVSQKKLKLFKTTSLSDIFSTLRLKNNTSAGIPTFNDPTKSDLPPSQDQPSTTAAMTKLSTQNHQKRQNPSTSNNSSKPAPTSIDDECQLHEINSKLVNSRGLHVSRSGRFKEKNKQRQRVYSVNGETMLSVDSTVIDNENEKHKKFNRNASLITQGQFSFLNDGEVVRSDPPRSAPALSLFSVSLVGYDDSNSKL
ncbi:hypothetical protein HELRODRAFT_189257 [Helobdella robusta]|uniref:Uncharacterized protein n=1 Tax=Helobdella robusta TaxID=6412 RepID=T1FQV6_HELRO|nr:hypothetical protein HELRODRAFT_189257 [Helobdella robusta]ESN96463.1 hypothetical protein HELRODRAFT_189257 [Helobdella robusta]